MHDNCRQHPVLSGNAPILKIMPYLKNVIVLSMSNKVDIVEYNKLKSSCLLEVQQATFINGCLRNNFLVAITDNKQVYNCYVYNLASRSIAKELQLKSHDGVSHVEYGSEFVFYCNSDKLFCQNISTPNSYDYIVLKSPPFHLHCCRDRDRDIIYVFCADNMVYSYFWENMKLIAFYEPIRLVSSTLFCHEFDCFLYYSEDKSIYHLDLMSLTYFINPLKTGIQEHIIQMTGSRSGIYCQTASSLYFTDCMRPLQLIKSDLKDAMQICHHNGIVFVTTSQNSVYYLKRPTIFDEQQSFISDAPPITPVSSNASPRHLHTRTLSELSGIRLRSDSLQRGSLFHTLNATRRPVSVITNVHPRRQQGSQFENSLFDHSHQIAISTSPSNALSKDAFCAVQLLRRVAEERLQASSRRFSLNSYRLEERKRLMKKLFTTNLNEECLKELNTIVFKLLGIRFCNIVQSDEEYITVLKAFFYDLDTDIITLDRFLGEYHVCLLTNSVLIVYRCI